MSMPAPSSVFFTASATLSRTKTRAPSSCQNRTAMSTLESPKEGKIDVRRLGFPLSKSLLPYKARQKNARCFSPDGLTGVTPDQFEDFFRLHATRPDGEAVLLTEAGVDYELDGGTLRLIDHRKDRLTQPGGPDAAARLQPP